MPHPSIQYSCIAIVLQILVKTSNSQIASRAPQNCLTVEGTKCVFPFKYKVKWRIINNISEVSLFLVIYPGLIHETSLPRNVNTPFFLSKFKHLL